MFDNLTRLGASGAGEDYEIGRSLRFNIGDSPRLDRAISSASNRKTWTLSVWFKISSIGQDGSIFAQGDQGSQRFVLAVTGNQLLFVDTTGSPDMNLTTKAYIRDVSAWYHVVIQYDTTQSTDTDRCKMYLNGEIPTFSTATYQAQNTDGYCNSTASGMRIGANPYNSSLSKFNGYLAEMHFIDGSIVPHTTFGKSGKADQWLPKEVKGVTYGTNGFYLNFADNSNTTAATLGNDASDNSNNFTPTNFSVAAGNGNDSVVDTPTNNYCTLNPIDLGTAGVTNGGLETNSSSGSGNSNSFSTIGLKSGKWYCEAKLIGSFGVGCSLTLSPLDHDSVSHDLDQSAWSSGTQLGKSYAFLTQYGNCYHSSVGNVLDYLPDGSIGDIYMMAIDLDNNKIWWGRGGTWGDNGGTGNPATGANAAFTNVGTVTGQTNETWCVVVNDVNTHHMSINFGQQGFTYTPPTDFLPICSKNLPEPTINKGKDYFNTVLYTGNATDDTNITGLNFQPDFTWIKARTTAGSSQNHVVFDSVRGAEETLWPNGAWEEDNTSNHVSSFNSNGVTIGTSGNLNVNNDTYAMWAWKETAAAGFDIVTYNGIKSSAGSDTISHNLGVAPELIIIKRRNGGYNWTVAHKDIGWGATHTLSLSSDSGANAFSSWDDFGAAPTSSVFTVSYSNRTNVSGGTFVAYLFASVEGYSKVGVYYGNGSNDGTFVYCGFKPQFVLMKRTNSTGPWYLYDTVRDPENVVDLSLYANTNGDEDQNVSDANNPKLDVLSNGFKCRGLHSGFNGNDDTHIFLAIAETPFKYNNGS